MWQRTAPASSMSASKYVGSYGILFGANEVSRRDRASSGVVRGTQMGCNTGQPRAIYFYTLMAGRPQGLETPGPHFGVLRSCMY